MKKAKRVNATCLLSSYGLSKLTPNIKEESKSSVEPVSAEKIAEVIKNGRGNESEAKTVKSSKGKKASENEKTEPKTTEQVKPYTKGELGKLLAKHMSDNKFPIAYSSLDKFAMSDVYGFVKLLKVAVDEKRMPKYSPPSHDAAS